MSPSAVHGLMRAGVYFPALVLTLFFLLWMLALATHSPRRPGFLTSRLLLASWLALAWRLAVFALDVRSKGRVLSMADDPLLPVALEMSDVAGLHAIMSAEFIGAALLHAALLVVVRLARRRPTPAP